MGFGGPVWHASASGPNELVSGFHARMALEGVGDADRGEWKQVTNIAVHLRRRLSEQEQAVIGDAKDIRGTAAEIERYTKLKMAVNPRVWERIEAMMEKK